MSALWEMQMAQPQHHATIPKPTQAEILEERVRNMAPWQTPPNSPSFRSVPPGYKHPERWREATRTAEVVTIPPFSEGYGTTQAPISPPLTLDLSRPRNHTHAVNETSKWLINIPKPTNFVPSNMVLNRGMASVLNTGTGLSNGQYHGNRQACSNKYQIPDLVNELNCALFLRNIPASTSLSTFFDSIDTGAVYALHIMPPNGSYSTCAAKLTFMDPNSAAQYLWKIQQGICFDGQWLQGCYNNREGYLRNTLSLSRVLYVEGPETMMTVDFWARYFSQVSVYQWDRVLESASANPGMKCMEFRFARINGQAQTCLQQIQRQEEFVGLVQARYGSDPCGWASGFREY